jgi:3-phosphoshikimate 1-carboxyvinyltransferase
MLGALAVGETAIEGLLEGEDVLATAAAMRAFGATVTRHEPRPWRVQGLGVGGLLEPEGVIDYGNAGTGVRLAMGLAGSHAFATTFTGDASLVRRPMGGCSIRSPHGRPGARPLRRPAAADDQGAGHADPDRLPPAGRLGAGEVGDPARRRSTRRA